MKRYSKWIVIMSVIFFFSMFLPVFVQSQPLGEPEPPCVGPDPMDGECPIDSGVVFLLVAGAGYGIKKVIDARKNYVAIDKMGTPSI